MLAMMSDAIEPGTVSRDAGRRGRADLHVHTLYCDGGQAPEAVVLAAAGRLDVVAITDHDRVAGALRARDYAREHPELGVDVVVGEEISTLNGHLEASLAGVGTIQQHQDASIGGLSHGR
jgi:3',5'-nucleoside bisphosphate phosphatase